MTVIGLHRSTVVRRSPAFASLELRFAAFLIDTTLFLFVQSLIAYFILGYPFSGYSAQGFFNSKFLILPSDPEFLNKVFNTYLYSLLINWLYFAGMETSPKQGTIGKLAMGIKVTSLDGHRINFLQATVRYFCRYLSAALFFGGFFIAFFNPRHQTLQDIVAGCTVRMRRLQRG